MYNSVTISFLNYTVHKNKIKEPIGWDDKILEWCLDEAKFSQLKDLDYWEGLRSTR